MLIGLVAGLIGLALGTFGVLAYRVSEKQRHLLDVDAEIWATEAALIPDFYARFGDRLPKALWDQHAALTARIDGQRAAAIAAE